jgi:hypothetical protein
MFGTWFEAYLLKHIVGTYLGCLMHIFGTWLRYILGTCVHGMYWHIV